jgi:hypothetical protein
MFKLLLNKQQTKKAFMKNHEMLQSSNLGACFAARIGKTRNPTQFNNPGLTTTCFGGLRIIPTKPTLLFCSKQITRCNYQFTFELASNQADQQL